MKLGIIGLPQSGRKTIFSLLTGMEISDAGAPGSKPLPGQAAIIDQRFSSLVKSYNPRKEAPARIDIVLFSSLDQNAMNDSAFINDITDADALCTVIRAFENESVYHVNGSVDPLRDIDMIMQELILHDLLFIEKRLERIDREIRKQNDQRVKDEKDVLLRLREHLEKDLPLRTCELQEEEKKTIPGYPFLTMKRMLLLLNVDDAKITDNSLALSVSESYANQDINVLQVSAAIESEIAALDTEDERAEFMEATGIEEPALEALSSLAMKSLNLISFFTVGEDEVKQWLIKDGLSAPEAAGAIHSDIQRGFIRAEVMKYADLKEAGSEEALKKAGKFHVMGRDYLVEDGDIINFRFNV